MRFRRRPASAAGATKRVGFRGVTPCRTGSAGATIARGGPLSRSNFRNREWRPAVEAAGLDFYPTVRDLRHAHASWSVNGGADIVAVKERLGHAHLSTTQGYFHTLPESDDQALAAFHKVRNRKPPTQPDLRIA
jgi:hypothetical protein